MIFSFRPSFFSDQNRQFPAPALEITDGRPLIQPPNQSVHRRYENRDHYEFNVLTAIHPICDVVKHLAQPHWKNKPILHALRKPDLPIVAFHQGLPVDVQSLLGHRLAGALGLRAQLKDKPTTEDHTTNTSSAS